MKGTIKMLEVLPIQDKTLQESVSLRCGVNYDPDLMAYAAYVDGKLVGICQFTMKEDGGRIVDLANVTDVTDTQALFVMGRAALNFIDLCGVHSAKCESDNIDETLLRAVGFSKNPDGIYEIDLAHFFEHPCSHNK